MGSHNNIHGPDDDLYFHCPNNDCPCNNPGSYHDGDIRTPNNATPDQSATNCRHFCCSAAICDCPKCHRGCPTCDNLSDHYDRAFDVDYGYAHHDNDCPVCHPTT